MADKPLDAEDIQKLLDGSPFIRSLGVTVTRVDREAQEIAMRVDLQPHLERAPNTSQFHGGAIASLIDTVGDFAVAIAVDGVVPTMNFRVDFLRPCIGEHIEATARARRVGRTVATVDIDVLDPAGRLCAVGRGTYSSIPG